MLKVGVSSAGWYHDSDPLGSLEYIKSCGFQSVDFDLSVYLDQKKLLAEGIYPTVYDKSVEELLAYFAPLKEASKKTGVVIGQIHAPYPAYYDGRDDLNDYFRAVLDKCFAVCEYLGCPSIVVHPLRGDNHAHELEITLKHYRELIPLIKKYKGVKICLENLFNRHEKRIYGGRLSDVGDARSMLDQLNEEAGGAYFGFCLDVGHTNLTHNNLKNFILEMGDRITNLHIHDNNGTDDLHILPYSCMSAKRHHVCDWEGFVEGLREIGYRGILSFETDLIFQSYPAAVHTEVLRLISAIGRYWSDRITQ